MAKLMCRTNPEIGPGSSALQTDSLPSEQPGKPNIDMQVLYYKWQLGRLKITLYII